MRGPLTRAALVGALALLLAGCRNECQQICREMADLYDACGKTWTREELSSCMQTYADPDDGTLATCEATSGSLEETLAQKSPTGDACDELDAYGQ